MAGDTTATDATDTTLEGSRDPRTGQCYWPKRTFSVDGELVRLDDVELPSTGELAAFVSAGDRCFGYVDLPGDVRLITELGTGPHEVGASYRAVVTESGRRFDRA
ncbi:MULTISPECIES: hypothetical protein [unclassified Gordonia (in: high G+C Gram-positive bacteria)]|uniref:hypothetical protein n=1 Tax=unclassified Gordonia (in: high G+C Gram-positive bacteria) TaxID=2657482 RepID=UPI0007E96AD8|nr:MULTISPECIES: hypothetical protein [unclassified Gordonia (in: high G+C Gram-positive bacteria)]OBB99645.1 hypothetical protein A5785_19920 [Gordonia sp. 852002-50395_SCH5434458]OBC13882.1 hypothetical protein A5788_18460 [Gordonia sp. 852002-50816_SCH5313054-c]OBC16190.1 hypothetical protein A5786_20645 [Gordonia sp. 852002-50816_SCH5313054-a]